MSIKFDSKRDELVNLVVSALDADCLAEAFALLKASSIWTVSDLKLLDANDWRALFPKPTVRAQLQAAVDFVAVEAVMATTVEKGVPPVGRRNRLACCEASHDRVYCRGHGINAKPLLWETDGKVYCFGTSTPLCGDDLHDPIAEAIAVHAHKERIMNARAKRRRQEAAVQPKPVTIITKDDNEPFTIKRNRQRQDHTEHVEAPSEEWTTWLT